MTEYIVPIIASFLPFFLWPIEQILPYPELLEEVSILLLTYSLLKVKNTTAAYNSAIASGVLFSFTEAVFYIFNIASVGFIETFFSRILITTLLHTFSFVVMLFFGRIRKELILIGFLLSLGVHILYNLIVV